MENTKKRYTLTMSIGIIDLANYFRKSKCTIVSVGCARRWNVEISLF